MIAFAFASLLALAQPPAGSANVAPSKANVAQSNANVAPQGAATEKATIAPEGTAAEGPPGRAEAAPVELPAQPGAIVIRNSGSTNTLGYAIEVSPDGAALVAQNGTAARKTLSADQTRKLFEDVRASMPLDAGSVRPCMRSVSFGSSTTVSYDHATITDLSCRSDAASAQLRRTVASVVEALGVSSLPRQRMQE